MKKILIFIVLMNLCITALCDVVDDNFIGEFIAAAIGRTAHEVRYDGSYFTMAYPNGDVPSGIGVCTDVVIRSFRQVGVDLQKNVHEDMLANFNAYPSRRIWGLNKPDKNIDHRRVPNLRAFFKRHGLSLQVTNNAADYLPGDIVTWTLLGNLPHIGIVIDRKATDGQMPLIAHNIGEGPKINNMLFDYPVTGHYRYTGK